MFLIKNEHQLAPAILLPIFLLLSPFFPKAYFTFVCPDGNKLNLSGEKKRRKRKEKKEENVHWVISTCWLYACFTFHAFAFFINFLLNHLSLSPSLPLSRSLLIIFIIKDIYADSTRLKYILFFVKAFFYM